MVEFTRHSFRLALMGSVLIAAMATLTTGATPPTDPRIVPRISEPEPIYVNTRVFKIAASPSDKVAASLSQKERDKASELRLYVRTPGSDWDRVSTIDPTDVEFIFRARRDGVYFFILTSVDSHSGTESPAELKMAQPSLKVIIDTQAPELQARLEISPKGETLLQCLIFDKNPDLNSIKLTCRTANGRLIEVGSVKGQPGMFQLLAEHGEPIEVTVSDLARNSSILDLNYKELLAGKVITNKTRKD